MALALGATAEQPVASIEAGSDPVRIPEANLMHGAEFIRSGTDLKLVAADGGELLVVNYFATGNPPPLVAPNGTSLDGQIVSLLAGPVAPAQYAQAGSAPVTDASSVGAVTQLEGNVTARSADGATHQLKVGDLVFQSDIISTGQGSLIGIKLVDGTVLSLQESGKLILSEVVYNPGGTSNSALLNVLEGTFSLFAGKIAPTGDMKIQTPIATMGIRGTSVLGVNVNSLGGRLSLTQDPDSHVGFIEVFNNLNGSLFTILNTLFSKITLTDNGMLLLSAKTADELAFDQQLTQLLHNFVPQAGPDNLQPQSGPPSFFDRPTFQNIIFEGPPSTPPDQLLIPTELLIPLIESLLQDPIIQQAIIEALEQPSAGSIELQPIAESDLAAVGPDNPSVDSSLPFSFGSSGPGSVGFQALDGQPVLANGQPVTLGGVPLVYSWDAGTNTLTAFAGQVPIFALTVDPTTGAFTLTLLSQIDHPLQGADILQLELDFTVIAANGAQVTGTLTVNVADDIPNALSDVAEVTASGGPSTNIVLMIDRSLSEAEFTLAKNAALALLTTATINQVLVVDFTGSVSDSNWISAADAAEYINGLSRSGSGGTDLDSALLRVFAEFWNADPADVTYMYALSNGGASFSDRVNFLEEIAWKFFLAGAGVDGVFTYAILGNGSSQLAPIGWDPSDPFDRPPVEDLTDPNQLAQHLNGILGISLLAEGNVLGNDDFGADGLGGIQSLQIDGLTFSFDGTVITQEPGQQNLLVNFSENYYQGPVFDGAKLSLQTEQGGWFTFYFADQGENSAGDWTYMAPPGAASLPYENFRYTFVDGDGDVSTSSLTIVTDPDSVTGSVVAGESGDDTVEGDAQTIDILVGNLGADTFVLNGDVADYIADYRLDEGDEIDLSAYLGGMEVTPNNVRLLEMGPGGVDELQVDTGAGFQTVAHLDSGAGAVNIIVDDSSTQVQSTMIV